MRKEIIPLILGTLNSLILFKFNLQDGINFSGIKIQYSLIDYSGKYSNETFLTTQLIGYIFFLIFILMIKKHFQYKKRIAIVAFIIILIIGVFNESTAIYEDLMGIFEGRHCRVGNTLTVLGILFMLKSNKN